MITNHITLDFNLNIRRILIEANDGIFDGTIDLYVHDIANLKDLMKTLSKIPGIQSINRVNMINYR